MSVCGIWIVLRFLIHVASEMGIIENDLKNKFIIIDVGFNIKYMTITKIIK